MVKFGDPNIVKDRIKSYLEIDENKYNDFIKSLKKYNAVIAGGFVLSCFTGFVSNDIDIYITNKDMKTFASNLPSFLYPYRLDFISKYESIGKKYIQRMLCYKHDNNEIKVDIVIIDDNYTIAQVIDNFDLTFCKIWFDGDDVYATFPKNIEKKEGALNKKYIAEFYLAIKRKEIDINLLHERYRKYTRRGFRIKIGKDPYPNRIEIPHREGDVPILLSERQTDENRIVKLLLENFTTNNIVRYLISNVQYYSKYISKYMAFDNHDLTKYILFKFYFISLFKEFTFTEYIKNFHILFKNVSTVYIYKSALYILQELLYRNYNIIINHDYNDKFNISFTNDEYHWTSILVTIRTFIENFKLNKYEDYKFTSIVDYSYVDTEDLRNGYQQYVLNNRNIDIYKIKSREFIKKLTEEKCVKLITRADVNRIVKTSKLTGFDFINCQDVNITEYLAEDKENIVIAVMSSGNKIVSITCISKKDLDSMISDMNDNWFYDCEIMYDRNKNEDEYLYKPYIKVPLANGTFYFEYNYVYSLFMSKQKIFFVYSLDIEIIKTVSYKNTSHGIRRGLENYVSANYCQDGSNIRLYQILTLKLDDRKAKSSSSSSK